MRPFIPENLGFGKEFEKLKELGILEPLINLAKVKGVQKVNEICIENVKDEELCRRFSDRLGQVFEKMTETNKSE